MKYSIVNGERKEAFQKGRGLCECCKKPTIAKCGSRIVHHWAHESLAECDNWWETETKWHRDWKNLFPIDWQEVTHIDQNTGEIHRADVKTNYGLVIELQNSPISYEEQTSREEFYKEMIWIVNGEKFKNTFHVLDKLPNPNDEFTKDICFNRRKHNHYGRVFFKFSESPELLLPRNEQPKGKLYRSHNVDDIQEEIEASYIGHHQFDWVKPRLNWLLNKSKVFIDFGDDKLHRIIQYGDYKLTALRIYNKQEIISRILEKGKINEV